MREILPKAARATFKERDFQTPIKSSGNLGFGNHIMSNLHTMKIIILCTFVIASCAVNCNAGFSGFYANRMITRRPHSTTGTTERPELIEPEEIQTEWIERSNQDRIKICHALATVFRKTLFCKKHLKNIPDLRIRFHSLPSAN